ncbi:multiple epidermal growth factor-like domains protein 11 [Pomacea canaliculata]|uniref:multiple epidermal growth factor-like domains protein 11 n=1 Tax=Pomacea canaliculata TaxID=400727 RepID=UPI000D7395F8|nr:multiple epidermal growth factor-like domains protein 11 [Pomacea canaliculata]
MALSKATKQSSTHSKFTSGSAAVDGRTPGGNITEFMTCIHTSENPRDEYPSWEVDLGHVYPVAYITIYGRPGFLRRMVDTTVTIDNHQCFSIKDMPSTNPFTLSCTTALSGRTVKIRRDSRNRNDISLNMCEVEVWGCLDGKYGWSCSQSCGQCANSLACDKVTGRCPTGCAAGWTDDLCQTECEDGKYGANCQLSCRRCKDDEACDKKTGKCAKGCPPGLLGDLCDQRE